MSTDTATLHPAISKAIERAEAMTDEYLLIEIEIVLAHYGEAMPINLAILRHEARRRGIFVASPDYPTVEDWMYDSDYAIAPDDGWVSVDDGSGPYDPLETYVGAGESMTWDDALTGLLDTTAKA